MECHKGFVALAQLVSPELVFFWGGGGVGMVTAGKMKNFTVLALAICLFLSQEPPHTTCRSYCIKPPQISAFCLDATFRSRQPPWFEYSTVLPWSSSNMTRINEKKWVPGKSWNYLFGMVIPVTSNRLGMKEMVIRVPSITWHGKTCWNMDLGCLVPGLSESYISQIQPSVCIPKKCQQRQWNWCFFRSWHLTKSKCAVISSDGL